MGGAASKNVKTEHLSLEELLTPDGSVDIRKATIVIWNHRHKPEVICELADILSECTDQKTVFEGIEFYLPQLAHMIIHLEVDWPTAALQQFVLIVCQHSLHFALQLHFILVGAMEDYRLETSDGRRNIHGNPRFYRRCAKLLQNVHRCVVYGSPRVHQLEHLYRSGKLTKTELEELGIAERRFLAAQILDPPDPAAGGRELAVMEGTLFYKRQNRRSCCHLKRWKTRWFKIQDRVLYCYNCQEGRLCRAIPLESAEVKVIDNPRHEWYFEVRSPSSGNIDIIYMLKATTEDDMQSWVNQIQKQSMAPTFHGRGEEHILYPAEYGRHQFFKSQRDFINRLTDISEEMRHIERPLRTKTLKERLAQVKVPEAAYLPLCKSTDAWQRILGIIPEEARAFSTKARCPCLVLFEVERDLTLDVANYLHQRYGALDDEALRSTRQLPPTPGHEGSEIVMAETIHLDTSTGTACLSTSGSMLAPAPLEHMQSVKTGSTMDPSARMQHGQEAPLLLGTSLEDDEKLPGEEKQLHHQHSQGGGTRRLSFSGLKTLRRESLKLPTTSTPTIWRVSRPSVSLELSKIPGELRNAIRKRGRSSMHHPTGSNGGVAGAQANAPAAGAATEPPAPPSTSRPVSFRLSKIDLGLSRSSLAGPTDEHRDGRSDSEGDAAKFVPCYGEVWVLKRQRLKDKTLFEEVAGRNLWDLQAVIVKSNDDVRQEVFVMQLISFYEETFKQSGIPVWLRPYKIMSTGNSTGLISFVTDAISIDALKKSDDYPGTLRGHFEKSYGGAGSDEFKAAQQNFAQSLASYSLISYLLGFKDRHNGNVMIDKKGHIIHIDFGFVFGMAPGGSFSFEKPPFKLTYEMVEVLDGVNSPMFKYYKDLMVRAFKVAREHGETAVVLMEIMNLHSKFPCFVKKGPAAINAFKQRLLFGQNVTDQQLQRIVEGLVYRSYGAVGTALYDRFQLLQNGILP